MGKPVWNVAVLCLFVASSAWCAGCSSAAGSPDGEAADQGGQTRAHLTRVKTVTPERAKLARTTRQPATVHAYYKAELYAKVTGYVEQVRADIGQRVKAGEVLATISVPELEKLREKQQAVIAQLEADEKRAAAGVAVAKASVEAAQAALEQAQADLATAEAEAKASQIEYDRVKELVERKAVAERLADEALKRYESAQAARQGAQAAVASARADLSVARARLAAAEADLVAATARKAVAAKELEEIEARLAYTTLRAPFDGVVVERHVDPGDLVREGGGAAGADNAPLFVVAQIDRVRVRVVVAENQTPWVNVGDPVTVVVSSMPNKPFRGKVDRIARSLDVSTRTMVVEVDLENPDGRLMPGMYGEATIELESRDNALVLPASAVYYDEQGHSQVFVVDANNKVHAVDVTTGLDDGKRIEIVSGLSDDARVIDAMVGRPQPGEQVLVEND